MSQRSCRGRKEVHDSNNKWWEWGELTGTNEKLDKKGRRATNHLRPLKQKQSEFSISEIYCWNSFISTIVVLVRHPQCLSSQPTTDCFIWLQFPHIFTNSICKSINSTIIPLKITINWGRLFGLIYRFQWYGLLSNCGYNYYCGGELST